MFSASFFLQTRSANVVWVPSLFLASFIQFPLFFCLFSIFSNDNVFAIRCKWQMSKSCLFFFLSTNFLCFPSKVWIAPFSLSIWPGTQLHSGGKRCAKCAEWAGRERVAEPWLCSPAIPLANPSLGSFCSLIFFFLPHNSWEPVHRLTCCLLLKCFTRCMDTLATECVH